LAGPGGIDGDIAVEMMRKAQRDDLDVVPGEERTIVRVPVARAELLGRAPRAPLVDVGDGGELDVPVAQMPRGDRVVWQDPSRPDDAVADPVERRRSPCGALLSAFARPYPYSDSAGHGQASALALGPGARHIRIAWTPASGCAAASAGFLYVPGFACVTGFVQCLSSARWVVNFLATACRNSDRELTSFANSPCRLVAGYEPFSSGTRSLAVFQTSKHRPHLHRPQLMMLPLSSGEVEAIVGHHS